MKSLRTRFERFCFRNRNKGIPNLMLYITIANAVVYVMSLIDGSNTLYYVLCFDRSLILQGQVWRLITGICTSVFGYGNPLFVAIGLFCYYSLGKAIEHSWGTFRFNLFYLTGILLMDIFAMAFGGMTFTYGGITYYMPSSFYADMGNSLNLSLFIAYATLYPDARFLLLYIIPVKAWIFALVYLGITLYQVIYYTFIVTAFPHGLYPIVGLMNYFLFFGKDVLNVIPLTWRSKGKKRKQPKPSAPPKTIPFPGAENRTAAAPKAAYTHRCTICGRTDVSNPELEFRYCSRCSGYHCYCQNHINDHVHIQ